MVSERLTHAGVVPYLRKDGQIYTVIITSKAGQWIFPKGRIDPGMTAPEAAEVEAFEEAGLKGTVKPEPVGLYIQPKNQWGDETPVEMYLMAVEEVLDDWQESGWRKREILPLAEAKMKVWEILREIVEKAGKSLQ